MSLIHLQSSATSLVVTAESARLPAVVYWGPSLGELSDRALHDMARAGTVSADENTFWSVSHALPVLPQPSDPWLARPGTLLTRDSGRSVSPRFLEVSHDVRSDAAGQQLVSTGIDRESGVEIEVRLRVDPSGVVMMGARIGNVGTDGADARLQVHQVAPCLPVPPSADELFDMNGRHLRERSPQRTDFTVGARVRESWEGRPGHDAALWLCAGERGFGYRAGLVHGMHVAWSGNHRLAAEHTSTGRKLLSGAELLEPGEIVLAPGESYRTPWIVASWGHGLDELAGRVHTWLRGQPGHPHSPRPVVVNTWEAVYFAQDADKLMALAERAAAIGAERFVLDDGWFLHRRHDRAGLGDWRVDPSVWPAGLDPLADRVRSLGMQFGLWVEPEMVNPDSDLAREHPSWLLDDGSGSALSHRHQRVLDLTRREAFDLILDRLDAVIRDHGVAYLKWDHNSPVVGQRHSDDGRPAVHEQTVAVYALFDELRRRHPILEIESCSSGGGRIDLEMARHASRFWSSDCIDAHENLRIYEGTALLIPPEMIGTHVGAPVSHTTGRIADLGFRAAVALWGHMGVEWDLTQVDDAGLRELAGWIDLHKRHRGLLHSGDTVHADLPRGENRRVSGVVARDRAEALYLIAATDTNSTWSAGPLPLPGLSPDRDYRVELLRATDHGAERAQWMRPDGIVLPGRVLGRYGLAVPTMRPDTALVVRVSPASGAEPAR
ncbi:MAG: alpha-galactosidase [Microbacterium sp.]|uniref:alpha-galactosidase n=1 Tax=Microbacterium sp. TaxID=51671 RepID=UPI0039E300FD